jgi:hypothetical protein
VFVIAGEIGDCSHLPAFPRSGTQTAKKKKRRKKDPGKMGVPEY